VPEVPAREPAIDVGQPAQDVRARDADEHADDGRQQDRGRHHAGGEDPEADDALDEHRQHVPRVAPSTGDCSGAAALFGDGGVLDVDHFRSFPRLDR
jgi:hypothetical protein